MLFSSIAVFPRRAHRTCVRQSAWSLQATTAAGRLQSDLTNPGVEMQRPVFALCSRPLGSHAHLWRPVFTYLCRCQEPLEPSVYMCTSTRPGVEHAAVHNLIPTRDMLHDVTGLANCERRFGAVIRTLEIIMVTRAFRLTSEFSRL